MKSNRINFFAAISLLCLPFLFTEHIQAQNTLRAGAAKVDVTNYEAGPVNDPLHVRALVIQSESDIAVIIAVDAVAIGEIGPIKNDYLPTVREKLNSELKIHPHHILVNASHCHGTVANNVAELTVEAVKEAYHNMVPVQVGVGIGHEDRIMENRRVHLKDGKVADVRHAYSLPPDEEIESVGPIDPQIGILRLDRMDGRVLAVVYNFAMHPIQSVPGNLNTADVTGFSSKVIEDNLGPETVALFVQGCGGDINPIHYKDVDHPRHAEPLGNMLGLSTLKGIRKIDTRSTDQLIVLHETLTLPRGDRTERIAELEAEQRRLLNSISGTSLNLKTFMPLLVKYKLAEDYPSNYPYRYLHDDLLDRQALRHLDAENRRNIEAYIRNIHTMEQLSRVNTNLKLLKKHQASLVQSGKRTIDVELNAIRVGNFKLLTFPGELTVQIGLNLKVKMDDQKTFIAGYTNGYIYYCPTAEQLLNVGGAQEDSDCLLAPEWQEIFESKAVKLLERLGSHSELIPK